MRLGRVIIIAVLLAGLLPRWGAALEPERPGQGSFLTRAAVAQGFLWTLSDAGVLSTVKLGSRVMTRQHIGRAVLDLCVRGSNPEIVIESASGHSWTIEHLSDRRWAADATVPTHGDGFVALVCGDTGLAVLTSRRLIAIHQGRPRAVRLSKELLPDTLASVFATGQTVFVGLNAGEWGGGLRRIDTRTGRVSIVEHTASTELCDGPLNTNCDPVTGIAADPWRKDCVVVAIGLGHFTPHGRIDEICGGNVRMLYYRRYPRAVRPDCKYPSGEPCETIAFFGVAVRGNELLAIGNDGLYQIRKDGTATYSPLPKFESAGDIYVSYDVPGFVLVLTDVNQRRSMSGSVPLLIRR